MILNLKPKFQIFYDVEGFPNATSKNERLNDAPDNLNTEAERKVKFPDPKDFARGLRDSLKNLQNGAENVKEMVVSKASEAIDYLIENTQLAAQTLGQKISKIAENSKILQALKMGAIDLTKKLTNEENITALKNKIGSFLSELGKSGDLALERLRARNQSRTTPDSQPSPQPNSEAPAQTTRQQPNAETNTAESGRSSSAENQESAGIAYDIQAVSNLISQAESQDSQSQSIVSRDIGDERLQSMVLSDLVPGVASETKMDKVKILAQGINAQKLWSEGKIGPNFKDLMLKFNQDGHGFFQSTDRRIVQTFAGTEMEQDTKAKQGLAIVSFTKTMESISNQAKARDKRDTTPNLQAFYLNATGNNSIASDVAMFSLQLSLEKAFAAKQLNLPKGIAPNDLVRDANTLKNYLSRASQSDRLAIEQQLKSLFTGQGASLNNTPTQANGQPSNQNNSQPQATRDQSNSSKDKQSQPRQDIDSKNGVENKKLSDVDKIEHISEDTTQTNSTREKIQNSTSDPYLQELVRKPEYKTELSKEEMSVFINKFDSVPVGARIKLDGIGGEIVLEKTAGDVFQQISNGAEVRISEILIKVRRGTYIPSIEILQSKTTATTNQK